MANTVAYNNGSNPVGSIKKGVVSINVDNSLITSGLTWRNGIEFTNQYIIYSDTYTQGIDTQQNAKPCAWSCDYNDTALRDLINSLPALIGQPKYSTLADAVAWLEGQGKYFIVNQNYPEIVTSGCVLNLDAGMTGSYPNVGTSWYDISGTLNNGSLVNGPTWINSGITSTVTFDGANDYVSAGNSESIRFLGNSTYTLSVLTKINRVVGAYPGWINKESTFNGFRDGYNLIYTIEGQPTNSIFIFTERFAQGVQTAVGYLIDRTSNLNKWLKIDSVYDGLNLNIYHNGVLMSTGVSSGLTTNTSKTLDIGLRTNNYNACDISSVNIYNRVLSQSEILQNYYKGKIVTDGLILALDAGNLVSYGGVGNTCYDLTTTGVTATLTNGVKWSPYSGGTFSFDGSDDRIDIPNSERVRPSAFTATVWVNCNVADGNQKTIFSSYYQVPVAGFAFQLYAGSGGNNRVRFFVGNNSTYQDYTGSLNVPINTWSHISVSYDGTSTMRIYVNGVADTTASWSGGCVYNTTSNLVQIGSVINSGYFPGSISNLQLYNRALTQQEIQQNFNTYRRRYGI